MPDYYLSRKAVKDLSDIWNYTYDHWSENQADRYYHMLLDSFKNIAIHPDKGKEYDGIFPNLLGYRVQKHIIFYRIGQPDGIEITRILHEKMDLNRRMLE